ncbi:site-specific integrase [Desulfopila sp. IMCC35008]|uniref:tyrosine-type recombinase/integrase n=1 Tax=Desulfopila sp. IMCC35008 TaxID=2653858 RepID=UPI0013D78577|nr:site-specific integrase [Desulfopila sp. IMCC35008]
MGKALSVSEVAGILNLDTRSVRKYYHNLGGIKVGPRKIVFFEKEVVNAVQAQRWISGTGEVVRRHEATKKTKFFKTKREAKKWEVKEAERLPEYTTVTESLGSWAVKYLDHAEIKFVPKTYSAKRLVFAVFFRYPGIDKNQSVDTLKRDKCLEFLNHTFRVQGGSGVNQYLKNLKAAWNWGIDFANLPELNPFSRIPRYPINPNPRYVPPLEDFWAIYDIAKEQDKTLLLAYLHTAGRKGDLFRLKWEHVDFSRRTITLISRKNKTATWIPRIIVMSDALYDCLKEQEERVKDSKNPYVFISDSTGEPWVSREKIMRELCAEAKVKAFGFHGIRHLSASLLYHNGVPMTEIQKILGHSNLTTTEGYIKSLVVEEVGASFLPTPARRK